jgi:hypothetical protein
MTYILYHEGQAVSTARDTYEWMAKCLGTEHHISSAVDNKQVIYFPTLMNLYVTLIIRIHLASGLQIVIFQSVIVHN